MQISNLHQWFDRLESFFPNVPYEIWLVAFFLPIVAALFSTRTVVFLASVLTSGIALFIVLKPSSVALALAGGSYGASLLVAIYGIQIRRKNSAAHAEMMSLRSELEDLKQTVERRYLAELKRKKTRSKDENQ